MNPGLLGKELRDQNRQERRDRNRRTVYWAVTVIAAVFLIVDICSDMVLRNKAFHFDKVSGHLGADSWDWACAVVQFVWIWMSVKIWRGKD